MYLWVKIDNGSDVPDELKQMVELSNKLSTNVIGFLNGVEITAYQDSTLVELLGQYNTGCRQLVAKLKREY